MGASEWHLLSHELKQRQICGPVEEVFHSGDGHSPLSCRNWADDVRAGGVLAWQGGRHVYTPRCLGVEGK